MTLAQAAIVVILLGMLAAYATERFRVELVALCGLGAGFLAGVVPVQNVFVGFASPAVVTVVEVLLVVAALSRARVIDSFARRIVYHFRSERAALAIICITGAAISVFMNNIGALALMFPVTMSVAQRLNLSPARMLMPLSFATLLGGMCSLTGTPANLVVNEWLISETGRDFGYFQLALLGGPLAAVGLAWIVAGAPLTFSRFTEGATLDEASPAHVVAERRVPQDSPLVGKRLPDLAEEQGVQVHAVMREGAHVFARRSDIALAAGDIVVVEADLSLLDELADAAALLPLQPVPEAAERREYVVMPESLLLGSRIGAIHAFAEHSLQVVGLSVRRGRIEGSFGEVQVGMGDVLVLAGERDDLRLIAAECSLLPLSPRRPGRFGGKAWLSVGIFIVGIVLTALNLAPTEIAFGAVVIALAATGNLNLRTALQDLNWSIVILLACMIPLGLAVQDTGTARLIANEIAEYLPASDPLVVGTTMLALAVLITPFIDNVSTAAILSPIAAGLASRTGTPIEPLLMAVAIGASVDFLTPFGHHNNTVVMGAGGYRFMDFPRFGFPLTILSFGVAVLVLSLMLPG